MMGEQLGDAIITPHATAELMRRGISLDTVRLVLKAPEQRLEVRPGRIVLQKRIAMGDPNKTYLVRVFVDIDRQPVEVVTVYRTSRVEKYWRHES
jgi:hypothetical protein